MAIINNTISIKNKVNQALMKPRYAGFAFQAANTRFITTKKELMDDFDNDPVNKELLEGPDAESSQFVSRGNLYSYVGFDEKAKPVETLRKFIDENTYIENKPKFDTKNNRFTYKFPVNVPNVQELEEATSMNKFADSYPNNKSFIELISGSIRGIGNFIFHKYFNKKYSRSTTSLQSKRVELGGSFSPATNYIVGIFNKFKARFKNR